MRPRLHPLVLLALVAALCAAVVGALAWYRSRKLATVADLVRRLPEGSKAVLFVDLRPLRDTGTLARALHAVKITEEPEYQAFVVETGFDAERDLDAVLVGFHEDHTYVLVLGRFQWGRLRQYAAAQGGSCRNAFCQVPGSAPERLVSFFPLRRDVLALAVGRDPWGALELMQPHSGMAPAGPRGVVWLSASAAWLRDRLPSPSVRSALSSVFADADRLFLWAELGTDGVQVRLELACRSEIHAAALAGQLRAAAERLLSDPSPGRADQSASTLAGVLSRGAFDHSGSRLFGRWQVEYSTLAALAAESF
ncbi:MAG: hypothetical protein RMK57_14815 [Bryobacterales bacterium]|nr:hypothetical protein [Bryobacteraceae bacterium]MDW8355793.1 hypothetical protein [Bryobacterales bacterium]